MEIPRAARNAVIGGALGFGVGFGGMHIVAEDIAAIEQKIAAIETDGTKLVASKSDVAKQVGEACFALLDPIYEAGMGYDDAVVALAMNKDEAVCGETAEQVSKAVTVVAKLESDIAKNFDDLNDANTKLETANANKRGRWAIGGFFGLIGAFGFYSETRKSQRWERNNRQGTISA